MQPGLRSLNVALACAMVTGEALRQLGRPLTHLGNAQQGRPLIR